MLKTADKYKVFLIYVVLAIMARAVFWQVHSFDFLNYDDDGYVSKNEHISSGLRWDNVKWVFANAHVGNWHPLTSLSHMLDCQLFDLKPGLHHLVNLLFHIVNTLLLFTVLWQMTGAIWQSAFVAAMFAVHPLHVESVAWISERKDVLNTLFWILTMVAYLRYVKNPKSGNYLLTVVLFTLGLMSKPMLVTLPFVLLLLDYWPLQRLSVKSFWEKTPLFILSAVSSVVTFFVQRSEGAVQKIQVLPMAVRAENAIASYGKYILKMFWPADLAVFYPHGGRSIAHWQVLTAGVLLAIVTIFVIRYSAKYRYLAVGWLWYLGTLVPVIGLVQVGDQAMADRYTYVPLTGLFIILAWGAGDLLANWKYRRISLGISAIAVISALSVCTWMQTSYWRNSGTLFEHALKATSGNYVAYNGLGLTLIGQNKPAQAIPLLERALHVRPDLAEAYCNLGIAYGALGRYETETQAYKQALSINLNYAEAQYNLGIAYYKLGRYEEAIEADKQAIRIKPDYADAYYNLGIVYSKLGRYQDAAEAFRQAIRIKPDDAGAHYSLGAAYLSAGDKNSAMEEYKILKTLNSELANQLFDTIVKPPAGN